MVSATAVVLGFVMTMVNCETPPTGILAGLNDLATVSGLLFTLRVLVAATVFTPPLVDSAPAGIVLRYAPPPAPVT